MINANILRINVKFFIHKNCRLRLAILFCIHPTWESRRCYTCWNDVATYKMYITAAWKCTKQMMMLVTTPNSLAYFRILSGPVWKENCAVLAKSSMGTRLRLHNAWEHCTCTPKREPVCAFGDEGTSLPSITHIISSTMQKQLSHSEKGRCHRWEKEREREREVSFYLLLIAIAF